MLFFLLLGYLEKKIVKMKFFIFNFFICVVKICKFFLDLFFFYLKDVEFVLDDVEVNLELLVNLFLRLDWKVFKMMFVEVFFFLCIYLV